MQTFTATLTAAVLAVHAALGCCWHHGHSHTPTASGPMAAQRACSHGHEHGERHRHEGNGPREDAPEENAPCGGQCEEDSCVFLAGGKPVMPDNGQAAVPVGGLLAASTDALFLPAAKRTRDVPPALPPPLRLHLAKRVLLI